LDHEEAYGTAMREIKNKGQNPWARRTYD
jgi:hypothetical protein